MSECVFCDAYREGSRVLFETNYWFVVLNLYPVRPGHALIIPIRHQSGILELTSEEETDYWLAFKNTILYLMSHGYSVEGVNTGFNLGAVAGQTVFHAHCHVIPRKAGDCDNPRGGIINFLTPDVVYPED